MHPLIAHRLVLARVRFDLRAVQRDVPELDQPRLLTQPQDLLEQPLQGVQMALAKITHGAKVRSVQPRHHLWFMFVLVSIYLLLPALKAAFDSEDRRVIALTALVAFVFSFGNAFVNWCFEALLYLRALPLNTEDGKLKFFHPLDTQGLDPFGGYAWTLVYFIVGGLVGRRPTAWTEALGGWTLGLIFAVSAAALFGFGLLMSRALPGTMFDTVFGGYRSIPSLAMTLSALLLLAKLPPVQGRLEGAVTSLGGNTLGVYLIHVPMIRCADHFLTALAGLTATFATLLYAVAVLLLAWALTLLLKKVPLVGQLFRI